MSAKDIACFEGLAVWFSKLTGTKMSTGNSGVTESR